MYVKSGVVLWFYEDFERKYFDCNLKIGFWLQLCQYKCKDRFFGKLWRRDKE